ncbi:PilT/PilU family type 4a pilus ATPase [Paenibacillus albicereus]|uniref:PilT/PilU family type 4a pilus ATPase n=1 Tax=Paenibacillus albicereus TaxID=2726185 RepID=A0A6H2GS07_9BACL|nr:PilT/PilU family type 4a pilus ATPase [Paenibacillus albicereus]QJC50211.1 PilT/PilU family type 4a pilus ATPase [Paenibacillus albicereus]
MNEPQGLLRELLREARERGASDLHLASGAPPLLRIDGMLTPAEAQAAPLGREQAQALLLPLLGERLERFDAEGEADLACEEDGCRYRLNVFRRLGGLGLAARVLPSATPTLEELGLSRVLVDWAQRRQGLLLVTGPTGSGKSSTLAALVGHLNRTRSQHIVTLEDPIEHVYEQGLSLIDQREVGRDTASFASGLRAALRQTPDVILVGEMRDAETMAAALTAAETGHLVLSTLHTADAPQAVDRIVDAFGADRQGQIRSQLASLLIGVHAQRLVRRAGGRGRVCAAEILVNTPAVANLIRSEKVHQLRGVMQTGRQQGMATLESSVQELLRQGAADPADARACLQERGE